MEKKLLKSLMAFQKELGPIVASSDNPYFKSKYIDLTDLTRLTDPILHKHGLIIVQTQGETEKEGHVSINTALYHVETGESIQSKTELPLKTRDPQAAGSAITYARRYSRATMLNVVTDKDDDAERAMGRSFSSNNNNNNDLFGGNN